MTPFWRTLSRVVMICIFLSFTGDVFAFQSDGSRGSRNIELIAHLPLGGMKATQGSASAGFEALGRTTGSLVLEQEAGRPFAYVASGGDRPGVHVVDIGGAKPRTVEFWESSTEVADLIHFRQGSNFYLAITHPTTGASILDISDPEEGVFETVASVDRDSGYHHGFAYRHSNGRSFLFMTGGQEIDVYDIEDVLSNASSTPVASISLPEEQPTIEYGYHAVQVQYEAETETDRLYAAGAGGYYVMDVTDIKNPAPLAMISSAAVEIGHAISASPDGSHVVTSTGYRTAPMRIFDLRPVFDGTIPRARTAVGAWTANWKGYSENHALRWPFVFTASMEEGLQVFNMRNPFEPYTVAFYKTWDGPSATLSNKTTNRTGAWDVDVRNSDGLVAVSDVNTGLWLFRMEGFEGWDGRGWGFPNVGDVQDWDNGPTMSTRW